MRRLSLGIVAAALTGCLDPAAIGALLSAKGQTAPGEQPASVTGTVVGKDDLPAPLTGTVVDKDGLAAPGVKVAAFLTNSAALTNGSPLIGNNASALTQGAPYRIQQAAAEAVTGADGKFALAVPPDGLFNLEAVRDHEDDAQVVKAWKRHVDRGAKVADAGRLTLAETGGVTGTVKVEVLALVRTVVDLTRFHVIVPGSPYFAAIAQDGTFSISGMSAGKFDVALFGELIAGLVPPELLAVVVNPGVTTTIPPLKLGFGLL